MFTTAGSTRLTIPEKELEDGIGSGRARGVALVPANEKLRMAETLPETIVPIKIPMTRVAVMATVATTLRRRVQSTRLRTWSICLTPLYSVAQSTFGEYNTPIEREFLSFYDAPRR